MDYPKKIMTMSELRQLDYPRKFLEKAVKVRNQDFAWRSGHSKNSPWYFGTELFDEYVRKECRNSGRF